MSHSKKLFLVGGHDSCKIFHLDLVHYFIRIHVDIGLNVNEVGQVFLCFLFPLLVRLHRLFFADLNSFQGFFFH